MDFKTEEMVRGLAVVFMFGLKTFLVPSTSKQYFMS